jgi:hypothetical protein
MQSLQNPPLCSTVAVPFPKGFRQQRGKYHWNADHNLILEVWEVGGLLAIITILPQISDFKIVVLEQKEKVHTRVQQF